MVSDAEVIIIRQKRHVFDTDLYQKIKIPVKFKFDLSHRSINTIMIIVHLVGTDVERALLNNWSTESANK